MELATAFPGNTGNRPNSVAPLAEMLRLNGYSTAAFGKYHETAPWEVSVSGPFDRWPTHSGFDKFYGFIGGETNQWAPAVYDGQTRIEVPHDPNYHFTTEFGDEINISSEELESLKAVGSYYEALAKNIDADNNGELDILTNTEISLTFHFNISIGKMGIDNVPPTDITNENYWINYGIEFAGGTSLGPVSNSSTLTGKEHQKAEIQWLILFCLFYASDHFELNKLTTRRLIRSLWF